MYQDPIDATEHDEPPTTGVPVADVAASPQEGGTDVSDDRREDLKGILTLNAGKIESHLDKTVRETVEKVLNDFLDAEADDLCGAKRYERSPDRME